MFRFLANFILFATVALAQQQPKLWAVLVAGSNDWYNYRHQADVCHAYQILRKHGIPDDNIIVMMYDDIANNTDNPTPGVIINHPNGPDVYKNVLKDYVGEDVTPKNFIKVLTGDKEGMRGIGSGKVLQSGPNDHVFINFVDHGATGILAFPTEELTVSELQAALKTMYNQKKYAKLVFYVEACESGSMFKGVLPTNINAFVTTASSADESSYACYYDDKRNTYLGDWYSVNWMEDTDQEDIVKETLLQQFTIVQKETNTSHVQKYGDMKIGKMTVSEFQGKKKASKILYKKTSKTTAPSYEVPLDILYRRLSSSNSQIKRQMIQDQINDMLAKRQMLEMVYSKIVKSIADNEEEERKWLSTRPERLTELRCHNELVHAFSKLCFNFGKNSYALKFAYILANMCEDRVDVSSTIDTFEEICGDMIIKEGIV